MAELKAKPRKSHLPLNDESHVRNAMARWNQTKFESPAKKEAARRKIVGAARKQKIALSDGDKVRPASPTRPLGARDL